MSDNAKRRPKIDCPSFWQDLFWPAYRLLKADEFSVFLTDVRSNQ
jgi:hypothetical protein